MRAKAVVPIVTTERMRETREFWVEKLGFEVACDHERYLGLRAGARGAPEIAFMRPEAEWPEAFDGRGATFAFEVEDADREHARLAALGVPILAEPADQPWGARAFVARDPNGVVVCVAHPLPAELALATRVR